MENSQQENLENKVVEDLIKSTPDLQYKEEEILEKMDILKTLGIPIESIDEIYLENGEVVYSLPIVNNIKDEIKVTKDDEGTILLQVTEGDIKNELIIKPDNSIILDGKEVIIEMISDTANASYGAARTGGIKWYAPSSAPSYLLNALYGSYTEVWRCANVSFQTSLKNIAFSTAVSALTGGVTGGVVGFTTSAFWEIVNYDGNSKSMSYIDYNSQCENNSRYFRARRYTYSQANFQGKRMTTYTYGLVV